METLDIIKQGLSHDELTYEGTFYTFNALPMRLRPQQQPYPPMWYMRNVETAAMDGMNTVIVGSLDSFEMNVKRYHELWKQHHGAGGRTMQGTEPKIGLVHHIVLAETEAEAIAIAKPAWDEYVWNLETPRRLEAERRGLTQFFGPEMRRRPVGVPAREADPERYRLPERTAEQRRRRANPGGIRRGRPGGRLQRHGRDPRLDPHVYG